MNDDELKATLLVALDKAHTDMTTCLNAFNAAKDTYYNLLNAYSLLDPEGATDE